MVPDRRRRVAGIGNINGDGLDDLLVGAPLADQPDRDDAGESYVVFGQAGGFASLLDPASLNGTTGFRVNGVEIGTASGGSVARAGDVNGDGIDDLLIGAPSTRGFGYTYTSGPPTASLEARRALAPRSSLPNWMAPPVSALTAAHAIGPAAPSRGSEISTEMASMISSSVLTLRASAAHTVQALPTSSSGRGTDFRIASI